MGCSARTRVSTSPKASSSSSARTSSARWSAMIRPHRQPRLYPDDPVGNADFCIRSTRYWRGQMAAAAATRRARARSSGAPRSSTTILAFTHCSISEYASSWRDRCQERALHRAARRKHGAKPGQRHRGHAVRLIQSLDAAGRAGTCPGLFPPRQPRCVAGSHLEALPSGCACAIGSCGERPDDRSDTSRRRSSPSPTPQKGTATPSDQARA